MAYDLLIRNGTIIDGTGRQGFIGDIGISNGKVVAVGHAEGDATSVIDARDRIVAPGFIDTHTHYDAQLFWDPMMSVSSWHGVTTVVTGNCGFAIAPTRPRDREKIVQSLEAVEGMNGESLREGLGRDNWKFESFPQYLDAVESVGSAINVGALAGHLPTRFYTMGEDAIQRHAEPQEVKKMCSYVSEALEAGALGFATSFSEVHVGFGGKPVASRYADYDEVKKLAGTVKHFDKAIFSPNIGDGLSLQQVGRIAEEIGSHVTWTPLVSNLVIHERDYRDELEETQTLSDRGIPIVAQVSPKPIFMDFQFSSSIHFESIPAYQPAAAVNGTGKMRLFADPAFRAVMREAVTQRSRIFAAAVAKIEIGEGCDASLIGKTLAEVAEARGISPVEVAFDLALESDLHGRFRIPLANHVDADVETLLTSPVTHISLGDGGAHMDQLCDANTPTFFLRRWVREKKVFSWEEGIRMLTSRQADIYNLRRGRLLAGWPADIVVFDPVTVGEAKLRRAFDLPANGSRLVSDAIGINSVIVNGVEIRHNGVDAIDRNGSLPGVTLRRGAMA